MVVVKAHAGIGAQTEHQRRCHAPAVVVDLIAAGDVAFVGHQVQAASDAVAELIVAIQGVALGLIAAPGPGAVERIAQVRTLADHVDGATGSAATSDRGVRALGHFHRLDGEDFAGLRTGIAHAVQVHRALAVEAANERAIAGGVATFAGTHGDARHGAQCILQGQGAGVLDHLLRDHGDRARGIYQRRGVLLRGGLVDLVIGAGLFSLAVDAGGVEGDSAAGGRVGGIGRRSAEGDADGRHDQAW
ncbi:hypothetical protein D3C71_1450680 [compost metagenome]